MFRLIVFVTLLGAGHCLWWEYPDYEADSETEHHDHNDDLEDHQPDWELNLVRDLRPWVNDDISEHKHDWHSSNDQRFIELSSYVIKADQYAQTLCKRYTNCKVEELFGTYEYEIVYTLPQCDPDNVTVKIKHRVLYVYARKSNADNSDEYFDLRILPDMLKTVDATWKYEKDKLTVVIPYEMKVKLKIQQEKTCLEVNEDVMTVPQAPNIQYRYGK